MTNQVQSAALIAFRYAEQQANYEAALNSIRNVRYKHLKGEFTPEEQEILMKTEEILENARNRYTQREAMKFIEANPA